MKLLLVGCEYAGTTTLGHGIRDWFERVAGTRIRLVHDHFKIPVTIGHAPEASVPPELTEEEQAQYLALSPRLKESLQRHNIYYHTPHQASSDRDDDRIVIGLHIEDAVYGPRYFGYGGPGQEGDRRVISQHIELRFAKFAPETVLVLVKASAKVVARRMRENPHQNQVIREEDIEHILGRFDQEFHYSQIRKKIVLDTSNTSVQETMAEFARLVEPHLTEADGTRIVRHSERIA